MSLNIQILTSDRINREKWDACIATSGNGLIYATAEYLDHMCDNWAAIIIDDYKIVMPLPWRKKYGIRYTYQPAFIQQLGVIGTDSVDTSFLSSFSSYGDILLNFGNQELAGKIKAEKRTNQVIDLSPGYEKIVSCYRKDLLLNLKKAQQSSLYLSARTDIDLAVRMYKLFYQERMKGVADKDYSNFAALAEHLSKKGSCFTRIVEDEKGTLLAIALFLKDDKRIYNLMNSTTDEGRKREANHFLLDAVIREFAGQSLLFDFEGSDIPGVKGFYEKFGATDQPYFVYHYNKLPAILKLFKR